MDILPLKSLTLEDAPIFGKENALLGNLARDSYCIASGIVVVAPILKLQSLMNYYDLNHKELFEQSIVLVKNALHKEPVPESLVKETKKKSKFFIGGKVLSNTKEVWHELLNIWLDEIRHRLWIEGFSPNIANNLTPQIICFVHRVEAFGEVYYDEIDGEVVIVTQQGKVAPAQQKELVQICESANKKLIIPHIYSWVLDGNIQLSSLSLYTPADEHLVLPKKPHEVITITEDQSRRCVTKVLLDISSGLIIEKNMDGVFIASEKIISPQNDNSFDELVLKITESSKTLPNTPIIFKMADIPETAGGIRGALRLLHQSSLLDLLIKALVFCKEKKHIKNINILIPFIRHINEFSKLKDVFIKNDLGRSHIVKIWMEICVVENLLNLDEYLKSGLDGIVINIDELIASIYGIDSSQEQLGYFKKEIKGLKKLLEIQLRQLLKEKIPVLVSGNCALDPILLEFLLEIGITGIICPRHEVTSIKDLLYRIEKKIVLVKSRSRQLS